MLGYPRRLTRVQGRPPVSRRLRSAFGRVLRSHRAADADEPPLGGSRIQDPRPVTTPRIPRLRCLASTPLPRPLTRLPPCSLLAAPSLEPSNAAKSLACLPHLRIHTLTHSRIPEFAHFSATFPLSFSCKGRILSTYSFENRIFDLFHRGDDSRNYWFCAYAHLCFARKPAKFITQKQDARRCAVRRASSSCVSVEVLAGTPCEARTGVRALFLCPERSLELVRFISKK